MPLNSLRRDCGRILEFESDFREVARVLYRHLLPMAGTHMLIAVRGIHRGSVDRQLGIFATQLEGNSEAKDLFERGLVLETVLGSLPYPTFGWCDYAAMRHESDQRGDRATARPMLEESASMAVDMGMTQLRERAEGLLAG